MNTEKAMETQLIVRINKDTKQKFSRIARTEGKTASTKVRELVSSYIEENDFSRVVGDIWDRTAKTLKKKGYTEKDVKDAIKSVRSST
jgi:predicted DNA-binding protein